MLIISIQLTQSAVQLHLFNMFNICLCCVVNLVDYYRQNLILNELNEMGNVRPDVLIQGDFGIGRVHHSELLKNLGYYHPLMGNSDPLWVSCRTNLHLELGNHFISSGSYYLGSCLIARAIHFAQYGYKLELQRRIRRNAPAGVTSKLIHLDSIDIEELLTMCDQMERKDSFVQHCMHQIGVYSADKFLPLESVPQVEGYMSRVIGVCICLNKLYLMSIIFCLLSHLMTVVFLL